MTQSIILYNICEQHAWYSKICCYLYPFRRYIQSVTVHGIKCIPDSNSRMNSWDQALCIHPAWVLNANWGSQPHRHKQEYLSAVTHALPLSTARQLALLLAFGVVRAQLLLYLNNTAPARTCLKLLNSFWCARNLSSRRQLPWLNRARLREPSQMSSVPSDVYSLTNQNCGILRVVSFY